MKAKWENHIKYRIKYIHLIVNNWKQEIIILQLYDEVAGGGRKEVS